MAYEFAIIEKKEHLWIITLNRPERMNALHSPAHKELDEIFNNFQKDDEAWVAIVTGSGDRAFSAGNDLKYQAEQQDLKKRIDLDTYGEYRLDPNTSGGYHRAQFQRSVRSMYEIKNKYHWSVKDLYQKHQEELDQIRNK